MRPLTNLRVENLFEQANMDEAFAHLHQKKGGCGVDGIRLDQFAAHWQLHGARIMDQVINDAYTPEAAQQIEVLSKYNKKRIVHRFTWTDRLLQRLIFQKLNPQIEKQFSSSSLAFQARKGISQAIVQAADHIEKGGLFVAEIDLEDYFGSIDRARLEVILRSIVPDQALYSLLIRYLHCPVESMDNQPPSKGILQGSSLSCIFANLYLHPFDKWLEERAVPFCRYCDDINIYAKTKQQALTIFQNAKQELEENYNLKINTRKSQVFPSVNRPWLGNEFYWYNKEQVRFRKLNRQGVYTNWNTSAIQKIDQHYHLVNNGILSRHDYTLLFESDSGKRYLPVEAIESINVYSNTAFTAGFFAFANQHRLRISIFDRYARCIGRFYGESSRKDASVLLKQVTIYQNEHERLRLAKAILIAAVSNIRDNLRYYRYKYSGNESLSKNAGNFTEHIRSLNQCKTIQELMLAEAKARNEYYSFFDAILFGENFVFEKRTKRPPRNPVNAMISFGNTLLYNRVATEIQKTSLNIQIGILHATGRRNESLHLDLAELFKPLIVDRVVFTLINKRMVQAEDHFDYQHGGGVLLNDAGKRIFLAEFDRKLYSKHQYDQEQLSYHTIIQREVQKLLYIVRNGGAYKPYRA